MKVTLDREILELREEYQNAHKETLEAEEKEGELLKRLRQNCDHLFVAGTPYKQSSSLEQSSEEFRVCEVCGTYEENGRTGYQELIAKRVRLVNEEEGRRLMQPLEEIEY
jgi:hypothetical protein